MLVEPSVLAEPPAHCHAVQQQGVPTELLANHRCVSRTHVVLLNFGVLCWAVKTTVSGNPLSACEDLNLVVFSFSLSQKLAHCGVQARLGTIVKNGFCILKSH